MSRYGPQPQWLRIVLSAVFGFTVAAGFAPEPLSFWIETVGLILLGVFLCWLSIHLQEEADG